MTGPAPIPATHATPAPDAGRSGARIPGTGFRGPRIRAAHLLGACVLALALTAGACKDSTTNPGGDIVFPEKDVSYAAHVQPFFTLRCANYGCHEDQTRAGNLSLTSYIAMTARPGIVVAGNSAASLLMQRIDGRLPHPINVPIIINENQLTGIRTWIDEGAKNN